MRNAKAGWALGLLLVLGIAGGESTVGVADTGSAVDPAAARQVFDRFRALEGEWRGKSTKGWTDRAAIRVIAAGSVVVETSEFEAHPDETMLTTYHLDGDRMMLTHYCMAKNQPRLQVTSVGDDGKRVVFTFRDGTNLSSRNVGHMDRVVFDFQDHDHFSSQWSFYRDGREDWMEEIHYERVR